MKRIKTFVVIGVFVVATSVLLWSALSTQIKVLRVDQLLNMQVSSRAQANAEQNTIRVDNGQLVAIDSRVPLRFKIAAESDPENWIQVVSDLSPPENFQLGKPVAITGRYDPQTKVFKAYSVKTMCPSRYEATKSGGYSSPTQVYGSTPSNAAQYSPRNQQGVE